MIASILKFRIESERPVLSVVIDEGCLHPAVQIIDAHEEISIVGVYPIDLLLELFGPHSALIREVTVPDLNTPRVAHLQEPLTVRQLDCLDDSKGVVFP